MVKRLAMLAQAVILPGGLASAGEETGQLTPLQTAARLRQGIPVYSCAMRPGWFYEMAGQCPGGDWEWVEDIQNAKAMFGQRREAPAAMTNRNRMEKE